MPSSRQPSAILAAKFRTSRCLGSRSGLASGLSSAGPGPVPLAAGPGAGPAPGPGPRPGSGPVT